MKSVSTIISQQIFEDRHRATQNANDASLPTYSAWIRITALRRTAVLIQHATERTERDIIERRAPARRFALGLRAEINTVQHKD